MWHKIKLLNLHSSHTTWPNTSARSNSSPPPTSSTCAATSKPLPSASSTCTFPCKTTSRTCCGRASSSSSIAYFPPPKHHRSRSPHPPQYIHDTLRAALPSLSINGLDDSAFAALLDPADGADADAAAARYEAYDDRLAARLRDTYARLEAETTRLAQLRREAPARAAAGWADGLRDDVEARERAFAESRARAAAAGEGAAEAGLGDVRMERPERVRGLWDGGRRELVGLKGVTEVVARLERAKRAVEEVERR